MTTDELFEALARLRVETGSLACLGCGHEHNCGIRGCLILREAAKALKQMSDLVEQLNKEIEWKDMVIALAQRKQTEAEAERDALIEQIKERHACLDCKHNDYCEFDDANVIDCMNCLKKNCPCAQCCDSSRWEWRGLPETPEEGDASV